MSRVVLSFIQSKRNWCFVCEDDTWHDFHVVLFLTELLIYQATAEQIRLAQMIYDKNDADFEDKVKQVVCLSICTHKDKFFRLTTVSTWPLTMICSLHCVDLSFLFCTADWGNWEDSRWVHGSPPWLQRRCKQSHQLPAGEHLWHSESLYRLTRAIFILYTSIVLVFTYPVTK